MRTTHHLLLAISLVSVTAFAGHKQDAKKHVDKAMKAHAEGKFDVALTELRAAYKLDPQPDLLYAMGQVYSKLGRCTDATESFEKFRNIKKKDATIGKVVDEAIAACKPADTPFSDSHPAEGTTAEAAKTDAAKNDAAKADAAKNDASKADAAKTDAAKSDSAKADTAKTDAAKANSATVKATTSAATTKATTARTTKATTKTTTARTSSSHTSSKATSKTTKSTTKKDDDLFDDRH